MTTRRNHILHSARQIRFTLVLAIVLTTLVGGPARATTSSTVIDMGSLGGGNTFGNAMNDNGQVVGESARADGASHGFLWSAADGMIDLGTLGDNSTATSISGTGNYVAGHSRVGSTSHAFLWTLSTGMIDLGMLAGGNTYVNAVNDLGQVVGLSETSGFTARAFSWTPGGG